jgi:hypothetical protein
MSTIITFSALFFSQRPNISARRSSSAHVNPRRDVPFIGRETSLSPSRQKKSSGEAEHTAKSAASTKAQ